MPLTDPALRGELTPDFESLTPEKYPTREAIRVRWDDIEALAQDYLKGITEDQLTQGVKHPTKTEEYQCLVWEGLFQVANHGTDHRAQILTMIHQFDGPTVAQDYLFYLWK